MYAEWNIFLCFPLSEICLQNIFIHLSYRDLFNLRAVSKQTLLIVEEYFHRIVRLDLSNSNQFKFHWDHFLLIVQNNKNVRELNLSNCKWIQESGFERWIQKQQNIQIVNLSGSYKVTNTILINMTEQCCSLHTLILQNCNWINCETMLSIIENCHKIQKIDLTSCWNLNDNIIKILFEKHGATLATVILSHIYSLSDATMLVIREHGQILKYLDISFCWRITDVGLK